MLVITPDKIYLGLFAVVFLIVLIWGLRYYIKKTVKSEIFNFNKKPKPQKYHKRQPKYVDMISDMDSYIDPLNDREDRDENQERDPRYDESMDPRYRDTDESEQKKPRRFRSQDIMMRDLVDAHEER